MRSPAPARLCPAVLYLLFCFGLFYLGTCDEHLRVNYNLTAHHHSTDQAVKKDKACFSEVSCEDDKCPRNMTVGTLPKFFYMYLQSTLPSQLRSNIFNEQ